MPNHRTVRHYIALTVFAVTVIAAALYAPTDRAPVHTPTVKATDACARHITVPELIDDCRWAVKRHGERRLHICGMDHRRSRFNLSACLNRP